MTHLAPGPAGEFPLAPMRAAPTWERRPHPPQESAAVQASATHPPKPDLKAEKRRSAVQGACVGAGCVIAVGLLGYVAYALLSEAKGRRASTTNGGEPAVGPAPPSPARRGPFADLAEPVRPG